MVDYSSFDVWTVIVQTGIISAALLLSNILRRRVPFIRGSLTPTAVIAGFVIMILRNTGLLPEELLSRSFLELLTYHGIAVGFIAMSLRVMKDSKTDDGGVKYTAAKSGALIVSTYLVQALLGLFAAFVLSWTFMPGFFKSSGVLLAMGFGQGPGQANNIGGTYEKTFGFTGGLSFALAIAAAGYLCACIIGVIYLNVITKKNKLEKNEHQEISGSVTVDTFQDENEIPISQSIDRFSVQAALVIFVYLITYVAIWGIIKLLGLFMEDVGTVSGLLWGFNFIFASMFAILVKTVIKALSRRNVMKRRYLNNYLLSRISGFAFDLMIIAGIASIEIKELSGLWVPFIIMVILGGVGTFVYLRFMCKKLYPGYYHEGFVGMFGMLTGTISSGVLLIRELDPEMKTPAANNLVLGSSFGIAFGAPLLIIVGKLPQSDASTYICFGIIAVYLLLLLGFIFLAGRRKKPSVKGGKESKKE